MSVRVLHFILFILFFTLQCFTPETSASHSLFVLKINNVVEKEYKAKQISHATYHQAKNASSKSIEDQSTDSSADSNEDIFEFELTDSETLYFHNYSFFLNNNNSKSFSHSYNFPQLPLVVQEIEWPPKHVL